jgi:hypothetical protein
MNNTIKYEALVHGLKVIDMNIKQLKEFGVSDIIIRQIRNTIHCNSSHLRNYLQEVHRLIDNFLTFNITATSRSQNKLFDSLDIIASRISPL